MNVIEVFILWAGGFQVAQSGIYIVNVTVPAERRAAVEATQEDDDWDPWRDDDSSAFRATQSECGGSFTALGWATRRFAMDCICRIIAQCETADPAHFSMALAQERRLHQSTGGAPTLDALLLSVWSDAQRPLKVKVCNSWRF